MTGEDDGGEGPADTFALVGDEVRAEILRALGDAREFNAARPTVSFSDLRREVNVEVRSSRFNYHLLGQYVEDVEDGYRLRPAGTALYRAMRAERFDRDVERGPFEVGTDCHRCGAGLRARYGTGEFELWCPDCEHRYLSSTRLPPGGVVDEDEAALLDRVHRHDRQQSFAFARGVCPTCASDLERRLVQSTDAAFRNPHDELYVFYGCEHCGNQDFRRVGEVLLFEPEARRFFGDRGTDVTETPKWELPFAGTDEHVTIASTDPWRIHLELEDDGDVRTLTVDGDLDVLAVDGE